MIINLEFPIIYYIFALKIKRLVVYEKDEQFNKGSDATTGHTREGV